MIAALIMLNSGGWGETPKICDMTGFLLIPAALVFGMLRAWKAART